MIWMEVGGKLISSLEVGLLYGYFKTHQQPAGLPVIIVQEELSEAQVLISDNIWEL